MLIQISFKIISKHILHMHIVGVIEAKYTELWYFGQYYLQEIKKKIFITVYSDNS